MTKEERKQLYAEFKSLLSDRNHKGLMDGFDIDNLGENMMLLKRVSAVGGNLLYCLMSNTRQR